jgi:nicotinate dehydrogenase subunit B
MIQVTINGIVRELPGNEEQSLLSVLREELNLTGAKPGCGEGACGACTVLVDAEPVYSCIVTLGEVAGHDVTTIEGLAQNNALHAVQQAFIDIGAMQCGYCTPGMILSTVALLQRNPSPDESEITTALNGNICRCCTYPRIIRAVKRAAELAQDRKHGAAMMRSGTDQESPPELRRPKSPWDLLRPEERDYFEILGPGLLVVLPPGAKPQSHQRSPGPWLSNGGVWLHVGTNGHVTAFTGKVDVGQDNRTTLTLLVAEELRLPLDAVQLVMGDTDLSPFDIGTFGSRSTPDPGEDLRMTAAFARERLLDVAAESWEIDRNDLVAANGQIRTRDGSRSVGYGELVMGMRRVETASPDAPVTSPAAWTSAGHPTPKLTAATIVTGALRFASDLTRPNLLHGKVLRPPAFGATLRSVNLSGARAIEGVIVVQEGAFVGVAAPDRATAERAIGAVHAEWDVPPQPSEADLAAFLRSHPTVGEGMNQPFHFDVGNLAEAMEAGPVKVAATYTAAYIAHVPLETQAALAEWEGDRLTVSMGTQTPFFTRRNLAEALGVPEERIRVIVPATGGGFGGRGGGSFAADAARLARATGRPVKVTSSREEEFTGGHLRPAALIDVRSAARPDGTLLAWEFTNINSGASAIRSPYAIPNQRISFQSAASPLRQGAYRALAATANTFARESHLDELAHALRIDPLDFRLRHLHDERLVAVFRAVAERLEWGRGHAPGQGQGLAGGVEKGGYVATGAEVRVDEAGRLTILRLVTAFDCGAIVNPDNLVNQIEGATIMALGGALFETIHFEAGAILNASLSAYRVPRFRDVPPIEVVLLDRKDVPSAGAGETPMIAVAPAIANAIFAASGRRIRSLPLVPEGTVL